MNSHGKDVLQIPVKIIKFIGNETIKNIMSNYIPPETITCDDRDPPWINKDMKQLILETNFRS